MTRRNQTLRLIAILMVLAGPWCRSSHRRFRSGRKMTATRRERPPEFPIEILFDDRYFLRPRDPDCAEGLVKEVSKNDLTSIDGRGATRRLFVSSSLATESVARYLSEIPVGDDGTSGECLPCPTTRVWRSPKRGGGLRLRRSEPDVPLDGLASIASTAEGFTVYADATQQPPLDLLDTGSDLVRFVLLDDEGRPPVLGNASISGSSRSRVMSAGTVDPATLAPLGCAGPFPVSVPIDQVDGGAVDELYATVGASLLPIAQRRTRGGRHSRS